MNRRERAAFPWPLAAWWNYRRKRFWVLAVLIAYTGAGFFLLPWVAKREAVAALEAQLGLPVTLQQVRTNPWALTLELEGFVIDAPDGDPLVGFDRLFVNVQVASLFNRALTLREVTLERPFGRVVRFGDGSLNVQALVPASDPDASDDVDEEPSAPFRLIIHDLAITNGQAVLRDESLAEPFETEIGPVELSVQELATLPDRIGQQRASIATASGTRLEWTGSIGLFPLRSAGKVSLEGPYLPLLYRYVQGLLNFELTRGDIQGAFDYALGLDPETGLDVEIRDAGWVLRDTALEYVEADQTRTRFATLPEIELRGGTLSLQDRVLKIGALTVSEPELRLWRNKDGSLSVGELLNTPSAAEPGTGALDSSGDSAAEPTAESWDFALNEFRIERLTAELADRSLDEPGTLGLRDFDVELKNISNQAGASFPLSLALGLESGGQLTIQGAVTALPDLRFQADVALRGLVLPAVQPWIAPLVNINVDSGKLNATAQLTLAPDSPLQLRAALQIPEFSLTDTIRKERLLGWGDLEIDQLAFDLGENRLEISQIDLQAPFVRLRIAEDKSTNFGALAAPATAPAAATESEPATPAEADAVPTESPPAANFAVAVGQVNLSDGDANFTDLSLPLPFTAEITELNGQLSTLSTTSREPAKITLKGRVDEYGLVEVNGVIQPRDPSASTDIRVLFRNVDMPRLSPYTTKFAGRKIDAGRLELNLRYRVDQGRLAGENGIVIKQLRLGDKLEVPGAADLPLGLAVALLTGPDGTIDLDMPVTGDVNDPSFSIGGVVLKTFANLITKAVTAPFNLLGRLAGLDTEKLDRVEFRPGSAELAPPEREKLAGLAKALVMRPNLGLEVRGVTDAQADSASLREARLNAEIEARLSQLPEGGSAMLTERRRRVLETLADERLSVDRAVLRESNRRPVDPSEPEGDQVLDEPAYLAALENLLAAAEAVGQPDLDTLAGQRALAVRSALTVDAQIDADRITLLDPGTAKLDGGWIPVRLKVQAVQN